MIPPFPPPLDQIDEYDHLHRWDLPAREDLESTNPLRLAAAMCGWLLVIGTAVLALVGLAWLLGLLTKPAHAAAPTTSPQWVDVTANGADPTDTADSTAAITGSITVAIMGGQPLYFPAGTYKVTSQITIDYAGVATSGFRIISDGATLDGRTIGSGPVLQVQCSGGTPSVPAQCYHFAAQGTLFINASTSGYPFVLGKTDFSDAHNAAKIDHLAVTNGSSGAGAGGCQFNLVMDSMVNAFCTSLGGGAGIALEQTMMSDISGLGSAAASGGRALVLENGKDLSNTFSAIQMTGSPICLSITTSNSGVNTFVSPHFNCVTAVSATASNNNVLINPRYSSTVVNFGPLSTGLSVLGPGSRAAWLFPAGTTYTAVALDDGLSISSFNATGASLSVTLPAIASVNAGWSMGFATDNAKGLSVAAPDSANIVAGGIAVNSLTLASGNYEYVKLQSDGTNWRAVAMTRRTTLLNGIEPSPWPSRWLYPSSTGYQAVASDNGNVISSRNAGGPLTVTLPSTTTLPTGWSLGFSTEGNNNLSVVVNATSGGTILYPGVGPSSGSTTLAFATPNGVINSEFAVLQYDGIGHFRLIESTSNVAAANNAIGAVSGIIRYAAPAVSSYLAAPNDNGTMISSANSPASFMAVTLPLSSTLNVGWIIGIRVGQAKINSVQTAGGDTATILLPGTLTPATSFSLVAQSRESAVVQFDGTNFIVLSVTPNSLSLLSSLLPQGTPATSVAACQTGAMEYDSSFLYLCTAPNLWKRSAWSSF